MENKFRLDDLDEDLTEDQKIDGIYQFKNRRELNDDRTFSYECQYHGKECPLVCKCADTCICEDHEVNLNKSKDNKSTTGCLLLLSGIIGASYEIYKLIKYL